LAMMGGCVGSGGGVLAREGGWGCLLFWQCVCGSGDDVNGELEVYCIRGMQVEVTGEEVGVERGCGDRVGSRVV
jgi:hypothetical protein